MGKMDKMDKTVVVFSGGLDSTSLLLQAVAKCQEVRALSFIYGQKHIRELQVASALCAELGVKHEIRDITSAFCHTRSALLQVGAPQYGMAQQLEIPKKSYAEHTSNDRDAYGGVSTTVPARNLLFGVYAMIEAATWQFNSAAMAVHKNDGDFYAYLDCLPETLHPFAAGLAEAFAHQIQLLFPFIYMQKWEVLHAGAVDEKAQIALGKSWSCYAAGDIHCGECATCRERKAAYQRAKLFDPTIYAK